jgi:hypothetical protein
MFVFALAAYAQQNGVGVATFRPLPPRQIEQMDRQRVHVAVLLQKHRPGHRLQRSPADFAELQSLIDAHAVQNTDAWGLQALGVVFGDALQAANAPLAWCEVTDELGTDPTLRVGSTSYQVNTLTMISKRVERGEAVDVLDLANHVKQSVAQATGGKQ